MSILDSFEPGITWWWSSRFVVSILGSWAFLNMSTQLLLIESAFRCMLNHSKVGDNAQYTSGTANRSWDCARVFDGNIITMFPKDGEYEWTTFIQKTVAEASLWGFTISALAAGFLATKYGGRSVLAIGHFLMAFSSVMTPIAANVSVGFVIFTQFMVGLGAGTTFPAMHVLWRHWAPPSERTRLPAISYTGIPLGILMADSLGGLICDQSVNRLGWPSMFYIHGSICVIWFILWIVLVSDSPAKSGRALEEEKVHLEEKLNPNGTITRGFPPIRCLQLLQSLPFLALTQSYIVGELGFFVLSVYVPRFFRTTMEFNVHVHGKGAFFGIPFITMALVLFPTSALADFLRNRGKPSNKAVRKIFDGLGKCGVAGMLLGLGFLDCHSWKLAVAMWTLAYAFHALQYSGHVINHLDIAPRYAGLLMGLTASFGAATHVICHHLFDLVTEQHTKEEFQSVMFTTSAMLIISTIIFSLLSSGDVQAWSVTDMLTKARGTMHSEHATLAGNMSKAGTLSDDYGASNRAALRASEDDSPSEMESEYDSQPEVDSDPPGPAQRSQWADIRIRSVERTPSDEKVPIGVPAVAPRSRANTLERARNRSKANTPEPPRASRNFNARAPEDDRILPPPPLGVAADVTIRPLIALPVGGAAHGGAGKRSDPGGKGWQEVLAKELGQDEGSLVDGSALGKKPTHLKADLIDLGSSEDRDDSGMATEASATSSYVNGADEKGWRTDVFRDLDFGAVSPQWRDGENPNPAGGLEELMQLGASSSNLCPDDDGAISSSPTDDNSTPRLRAEADRGEAKGEEDKAPSGRAHLSRQPNVPHFSSMGDSPLSEHSSNAAKEEEGRGSDTDNVEDILDAETSIPLESDGEPLVTRI